MTLDSRWWTATRFRLRTGKALQCRRKEVAVHFRDGDEMRIGIDGPEDVRLQLRGVTLSSEACCADLPPYAEVLFDLVSGGSYLSVSAEEAEQAWRIIDPVAAAWDEGLVPLLEYDAESAGPPRLAI